MNSRLTSGIIFLLGATAGSAVTWYLLKNKYEKIAQEEIDSVKQTYSKPRVIVNDKTESQRRAAAESAKEKPDIMEYATRVSDSGYISYSERTKDRKEETIGRDRPYAISPDEFGENEDYERISLLYFSDGILADEEFNIVDDIDDIVGEDFFDHFDEYEDDMAYIRNDARRCDYEIMADLRTFSGALSSERPYLDR